MTTKDGLRLFVGIVVMTGTSRHTDTFVIWSSDQDRAVGWMIRTAQENHVGLKFESYVVDDVTDYAASGFVA